MTAIGLALVIVAILGAVFDDYCTLPEWATAIFGCCGLAGAVLSLAGALVFIWRVMP